MGMVRLDVVSDMVLIWVMIFMNLSFLIFRLVLRRRQREGLRLSDFFAVTAFLVILIGTSLVTHGNQKEIQFIKEHPLGPPDPRTGHPNSRLDPVAFGFPGDLKKQYGELFFASLLLNISALWITKAAFVAFYYEVFPKHPQAIRYSLHATAVFVGCTGIASFMESVFWCWPLSRSKGGSLAKLCTPKLDPIYNASTFSLHVLSTLIIAILPLLLVGQVELRRRELTFVITMIFLGALSFAGSISALAAILSVRLSAFEVSVKHAIYVSTLADQNAMFLAACLSPLRLRIGRKVVTQNAPLVIEVEKTWNVECDIVECWGHRPGDPFGSDIEMRTEILARGNETFVSKDTR